MLRDSAVTHLELSLGIGITSVPDGRPARLERVCFIARDLSLRSSRHSSASSVQANAVLVELQLLRGVTAVRLVLLPDGLFHPDLSFLTHRASETCGKTLLSACTSQIPVQELRSGQRRRTAFLLRQRTRAEMLTQTDSPASSAGTGPCLLTG